MQQISFAKNNTIKKWTKDLNQHFFKRYTEGQHEKMLNFTSHQGNANQSHNEIPSHTY